MIRMQKKIFPVFTSLMILSLPLKAEVTLPRIFSDNMVIQRDVTTKVWGWAEKGESIVISFNNATVKTKADKNGNWSVSFRPMVYGGPFEMTVKGKKNLITLKNILIGDVWLGSGQSNMEWVLKNTNDAETEIVNANYPAIRLFTVKRAMSYDEQSDLAGGEWRECNSQTAGDFSAVAYFFGRKLNEDMNVPIGLINSSWGGTNIQTWMSWERMLQKEEYRNFDISTLRVSAKDEAEKRKRYEDALVNEKGTTEGWHLTTDLSDWKKMRLPQTWEASEIGQADGYAWFIKEFDVPSGRTAQDISISLGPIDDQDETYLNGELIGSSRGATIDRVYKVSGDKLKGGTNRIAIRVYDMARRGGIWGRPDQLFCQTGSKKISLAGEWFFKTSVLTTDFGVKDSHPNTFPSQLYNAMIAPVIQFPVKGVIWYQGESNAQEAYLYRSLFPEMINDWRKKWNNEFPFLWVQLANYMAPDSVPAQSEWAELREAQSMTMSLPKTGQAVIIDIGEAHDIHPRNKRDVGNRLALGALKVAYNKDIVYTGPVYRSMEKKDDKIVLTFSNTGSGLWVRDKYGYIKGFAIAGADQKFVWANAFLEGDKIVVYNAVVRDPVAVRYAWGNNPDDANLYNKEGLPASPFRTDTWPGISKGQK
jgi:sialate O-acetylesterase